jgi:NAD(P)-dependent dehydrogenase (short-subunit alcohol dehydrogenase family)
MTSRVHKQPVDDQNLPLGVRWGVGGAIAQRFAREGFFTVLTTRREVNASGLATEIQRQGGRTMIVELDLGSESSISDAFATIRREAGEPDVVIYNAGYADGRDLPEGQELLEYVPVSMLDRANEVSSRGPFLVVKQVLTSMRERGHGSIFFSNNSKSLRGHQRMTGESLYYPRVMMRALAQVLTEEYSPFGVHVANVIIDGRIDSPGTRPAKGEAYTPDLFINPDRVADAFFYLFTQDPSVWTHEIQLTPFLKRPSY